MDDAFVERVAAPVRQVSGIVALVLGGSRARGSHRPTSDYDFGLYVDADQFDIAALNRAAQMLDDQRRPELCTPMGGWGPWVTGFMRTPEWLRERVDQLFATLPADPSGACDLLEALNRDVGALRA